MTVMKATWSILQQHILGTRAILPEILFLTSPSLGAD
jgi:hypothetical protein